MVFNRIFIDLDIVYFFVCLFLVGFFYFIEYFMVYQYYWNNLYFYIQMEGKKEEYDYKFYSELCI